MTWGQYISALGVENICKLQNRFYRGVTYKGRTIHWFTREFNHEWKSYFSIAICGKEMSEVNEVIGLDIKACPDCIKKASNYLKTNPNR